MSSLKKRQHYVWRNYLRAWSKEEYILTYFKDDNKVVSGNLMNFAQEKYFYRLFELSDKEKNLLKVMANMGHPMLRKMKNDFLVAAIGYSDLCKNKVKSSKKYSEKECENQLREYEINTIENVQSMIENLGNELISCRNLNNVKSLEKSEFGLANSIMYLSFQYFRTKKIKNSWVNNLGNKDGIRIERIVNILGLYMAIDTAWDIFSNEKLRIRFFENTTNINFITSDQPVINLLGDDTDEEGNVKSLDFYYPLSPKSAISIHSDVKQKKKFENILISEEKIKFLNQKQLKNSFKFVFSDSEIQLKQLMK